MFKALFAARDQLAEGKEVSDGAFQQFKEGLSQFAFYPELVQRLGEKGIEKDWALTALPVSSLISVLVFLISIISIKSGSLRVLPTGKRKKLFNQNNIE